MKDCQCMQGGGRVSVELGTLVFPTAYDVAESPLIKCLSPSSVFPIGCLPLFVKQGCVLVKF